ncbi:hypothetical protein [Sulfitobacter mediterraneus]|uniref:hypothetical protein n=1 Tax=Sulfitobacter mediterraneus TaxID=83219 RepID=UPI0013C4D2E6|nr:hypothetical protein [Sulfitobacter mediterraneus]
MTSGTPLNDLIFQNGLTDSFFYQLVKLLQRQEIGLPTVTAQSLGETQRPLFPRYPFYRVVVNAPVACAFSNETRMPAVPDAISGRFLTKLLLECGAACASNKEIQNDI